MKRIVLVFFLVTLCVTVWMPSVLEAVEKPNYVVVKGGMYSPTDDLDDAGFETGFNGEIAYGYRFFRSLALEAGIGYFTSDASESGFNPFLGGFSEDDDIDVIPVTFTIKGIIPTDVVQFYGGAGLGIYFASFDGDLVSSAGRASVDDNDTVFGGHVMAGLNIDITDTVFIGVESKYMFTNDAEFEIETTIPVPVGDVETNLNGVTLTGNLGFRF